MNALELFNHLYTRGEEILVMVDPRVEGLDLPKSVKEQDMDEIVLLYGANLARPTLDVHADDRGISAVLSFGMQGTPTFVPWTAVRAVGTPEAFEQASEVLREGDILETVDGQSFSLGPDDDTIVPARPFGVLNGGGEQSEEPRPAPELRVVK